MVVGIEANKIARDPEIAKYWKISKKSFPQNSFENTLLHAYTQLTALQNRFLRYALLTVDKISILSSIAQRLRKRKKCADF